VRKISLQEKLKIRKIRSEGRLKPKMGLFQNTFSEEMEAQLVSYYRTIKPFYALVT